MPEDKIRPLSNIRKVPQSTWDRFSQQAGPKGMDVGQPKLLDYFTRQLEAHIKTNGADAMREIIATYFKESDSETD